MNLVSELQTVTAAEISAAYRAADLRHTRPGYSLLTALNTPCVARALRLQAIARRRAEQNLTEKESRHAHRFETQE